MAIVDDFKEERERMVRVQLEQRGIHDAAVLAAMRKVPREEFLPVALRGRAYIDTALPLDTATISQPYIVAYMTELAKVTPGDRVLEIGTGSGYQSAILVEIGAEVFTVEVRPLLAETARLRLKALGYEGVHFRCGNGWEGWPEEAPYEAMIVTAAPTIIPPALAEQLVEDGRLVIPVGPGFDQELIVATKHGDELHKRRLAPVAFVPLVHFEDE